VRDVDLQHVATFRWITPTPANLPAQGLALDWPERKQGGGCAGLITDVRILGK